MAYLYIHTVVCNRLTFILRNYLLEIQLSVFLLVFFNFLLLNSFYFLLHIFGLSIPFSVLGLSFCPPFFPIPYFIVIIFAHFPSYFQYLQESFSLLLLLCSPLSFFFFFLFLGGLDFQISLLSIPQIHQIHLLPAHSGTHSKALLLCIHKKCSVS